ncbi:MAG: UDP-N-acetylmuramate--L-alanine ligase [Paludibacteraceae bacterium]|nr:UDP-N-acetylmuramate--L-alanine ligase [Paludibacteraceae bacterium]
MLQTNDIQSLYFLGIGGIGMSALARYFKHLGYDVQGYDRTPSPLTKELEQEGIGVQYDDTILFLECSKHPSSIHPAHTLVVRTPAVPEDQPIYTYFREHGYTILKRSEVLGLVTKQKKALCVAGTHGKTTTSTILAHIMHESHLGTNAFLGGISNNYGSNLLIDANSDFVVVEADEYDRSFHHLSPYMSVITSIDPDHLDIYGTGDEYQKGFDIYAGLVQEAVLLKATYQLHPVGPHAPRIYTYIGVAGEYGNVSADFYAENVIVEDGNLWFDFVGPSMRIRHIQLGVPVWVNIENSVAAMALAWLNGATEDEIRRGVESYNGVYRRFNIHVKTPTITYVDDYAHHPTELNASIQSIRKLYPERHFIVVFQPHLYTRTRDFAAGFKQVLSQSDELILLPIYPARELPIPGVVSEILMTGNQNRNERVVEKKDLVAYLDRRIRDLNKPVVVLTLGAGDIDRLVPAIAEQLSK